MNNPENSSNLYPVQCDGATPMSCRLYRKANVPISLLGFGCMRLPELADGKIDEKATFQMVDYALENGINYFDTAFLYHSGESEIVIGKALMNYPRETFFLANKMPTWDLTTIEAAEERFELQLRKCRVDYFDFYLVHSLNADYFADAERIKLYDMLQRKREEGKLRELGFSFHDNPSVLMEVADSHQWDFAQIQLNYFDWEALDAQRQYKILTDRGIPVIVMEPLRGGVLAELNEPGRKILQAADPVRSIASWGLRYAASLPNVLTVLSGMSNFDQLQENIKTFSNFTALSSDEHAILNEALLAYRSSHTIGCTGCRYCMECPSGVDIPRAFAIYNQYKISDFNLDFINSYLTLEPDKRADHCIECGICSPKCPQKINIPKMLKIVVDTEQKLNAE